MDIVLSTDEVWQLDFEFDPLAFLAAAAQLMKKGDIAVFGAYEPTPELASALKAVGAVARAHIPEFFTCFDANRSEHPHGTAFEYAIGDSGFSDIIKLDRSVLRQADIPSFYDHFIAFRPESTRRPLISFHDAACGGTLYVTGDYDQDCVSEMARRLGGTIARVRNPAYAPQA